MRLIAALRTAWVLCISIAIAHGQTVAPKTRPRPQLNDAVQRVLAVDEARRIAMLHGDTVALESLVADDATIFWGDGTADSKTTMLELFRSGRLRYIQLDYEETRARIYGNTAVLTGRALIQLFSDKHTAKTVARLTRVYVREQGQWRLVASQTTRIP